MGFVAELGSMLGITGCDVGQKKFVGSTLALFLSPDGGWLPMGGFPPSLPIHFSTN